MSYYFHAVAIDYDGTLTTAPRASADVLRAVRTVREQGRKCVLVTGRIIAELRADFPDVDDHFDAIVAENGGVLVIDHGPERSLAEPIESELETALRARGMRIRRGSVLLATSATHDAEVNSEIGRLGLECRTVRNRSELMVLPAGTNKGSGVTRALAALNLSPHSAVAIGDAENDHSLLNACEIGVAVGNALDSLKVRADVVLSASDGEGVAAFLLEPFLHDLQGVAPRRWHLSLGTFEDGSTATVPASRTNILITGPSGGGKSYFAGTLAEQLVELGYVICVLDLEGDHVALGDLHGVVTVGGRHSRPNPREIVALLTHGGTSVVVDLSLLGESEKESAALAVLDALHRAREETGLPHWIFVDEAHVPFERRRDGSWCHDPRPSGLCIITYRPELLCPQLAAADYRMVIDPNTGAMFGRRHDSTLRRFMYAERSVGHVRHWHKYTAARLPPDRQFVFRDSSGRAVASAANIPEFAAIVAATPFDVLRNHAQRRDFSRWLGDLCRDRHVMALVREVEVALTRATHSSDAIPHRARFAQVLQGVCAS